MKLVIQGKNIDITESIRDYVGTKVEKAVAHFDYLLTEIDVHLSVEKNPRISPAKQVAEVTMYVNGSVVRAQESSENLYASIDMVADKIARQLRKYKEKRQDRTRETLRASEVLAESANVASLLENRTPELPAEVVRTKYFTMAPMTVEAAMEQLQVIDHDFYMFQNADTGEMNVIYERNHGGYGVIQPRKVAAQNGNGKGHQNHMEEFDIGAMELLHSR
ncbi:MAG: ribosome-associated translation inhibitor RaiA [Alkalinema sp. RU_4_3]|nr:ribosome-associated translation inhibitor RaiA [Alkalinema sp. RU_4_3]